MENQEVGNLPEEVAVIAKNVPVETKSEVQAVLNKIFDGVAKMRKQLDGVVVADENDKINMKLANTIRLGVRDERLNGEKVFDAKRTEVQNKMLGYKTEDSLWLKAKQTMQILTKEIEEQARWKEETKIRFDKEQKEFRNQQRALEIAKFAPDLPLSEFENMSDDGFKMFLSGIEKAYNDKIEEDRKLEEEKIEAQRKANLHNTRNALAMPYYAYWSEFEKTLNFGECSEGDFNAFMDRNRRAKSNDDENKRKIEAENNRLKAEKETKDKRRAERSQILQPFIVFIRDYNALIESDESDFEKQFSDIKKGAEIQWKKDRKDAIAKKEQEAKNYEILKAKEKLEAQLKKKKEDDDKAKKEADKKAKAATDKEKLEALCEKIKLLEIPELKSEEAKKILNDTQTLLSKVTKFITDKLIEI